MKNLLRMVAVAGLACAGALLPRAAAAEIVIAAAGPMSGPFAPLGAQMRQGAELAVADINAAGGVLGQPVRLVLKDDACESAWAAAVAEEIAAGGIRFVAGHFCFEASMAASEIYHRLGVLQISPATSNPDLTERGFGNLFRVCGRDDQQALIAGNYLAETFRAANIAIAHDNLKHGRSLARSVKRQLNKRSVTEALFAAVPAGGDDYSEFIRLLRRGGIDVLYYAGYHTEAGLIAQQMRAAGLETALVASDALADEEFWAIAGEAGEGALFTDRADPRRHPAAADAVARLRAAGSAADGFTLHTYAAVRVWAAAATNAGALDAKAVAAALHGKTFRTLLGDLTFDAKGDVKQPAYVWHEWRGGTIVTK
jgi:branched-chain amino acid transport system substrate-binding protein